MSPQDKSECGNRGGSFDEGRRLKLVFYGRWLVAELKMQAKPSRDERAYVLSEKFIDIVEHSPNIWPSEKKLRRFLKTHFAGVGFRNEFLGLARKRQPVGKSFLSKIAAYLLLEHRSVLSDEYSIDDSTSTDDFLSQIIEPAVWAKQSMRRGRDVVSEGPAAVLQEMLTIGHRIGNAGPLQPVDADLAVAVLQASLGDVYSQGIDLPPFQESVELGKRILRQSTAETRLQFLNWIEYCPNSIWIRKDRTPEKTLLTIAMPLSEESYQGFLRGEKDEHEILTQPSCQRSSRILYYTASGDARNTRRARFNLMIMSQNQLQTMLLPVTKHETRFAAYFHEGILGRRATNWGFRDTGNIAKRYQRLKVPGGFLPEVRTSELVLPVPRVPSKRAILWAMFFLWQCFHRGEPPQSDHLTTNL